MENHQQHTDDEHTIHGHLVDKKYQFIEHGYCMTQDHEANES